MSNYLEHLPSADAVIEQLRVARQLLRPGGRVIVLQPNIRLVGPRYWDFIDHRVALTEHSLEEAADLAGLADREAHRPVPAVLDQGPASRPSGAGPPLPAVPAGWRLLGKQTLYVGDAR